MSGYAEQTILEKQEEYAYKAHMWVLFFNPQMMARHMERLKREESLRGRQFTDQQPNGKAA